MLKITVVFLQYFTCNSQTVEWMQDFMNAMYSIYIFLSEYKHFFYLYIIQ